MLALSGEIVGKLGMCISVCLPLAAPRGDLTDGTEAAAAPTVSLLLLDAVDVAAVVELLLPGREVVMVVVDEGVSVT